MADKIAFGVDGDTVNSWLSVELSLIEQKVEEQTRLMDEINALPGVNKKLSKEDVYIRKMRLAGDALNSQLGRFRTDELPKMLELTNGAPVMIGHDVEKAPVGRFFGGDLVKEGEVTFIRPNFYWPKKLSSSADMAENIDTGIYNEASIGFNYKQPTCSICGEDIRNGKKCEHIPGREYDGEICHYYYDNVTAVYEGSIVYRGAHPGTGMELGDELRAALENKSQQMKQIKQIPPCDPPKADKSPGNRGDDKTQQKKQDNQIDDGGAKMLTEKEQTELAKALGLSDPATATAQAFLDAANKAVEKLEEVEGQLTELKAKAELGEKYVADLRADILKLDLSYCTVKDREQSKSLVIMVNKSSDVDYLREMRDQFSERLDEALPPLKCQNCGSTEIAHRSSETDDLGGQQAAPQKRRVNPGSVRV